MTGRSQKLLSHSSQVGKLQVQSEMLFQKQKVESDQGTHPKLTSDLHIYKNMHLYITEIEGEGRVWEGRGEREMERDTHKERNNIFHLKLL